MQRKHMIEKRCKIVIPNATYISVSCKNCKGETNIPMQTRKEIQSCGVCGAYFGESVVRYISHLKKTELIQSEDIDFDISLVSVERVE